MKHTLATKSHDAIPLAKSLISAGLGFEIAEDYDLLDVNALITRGREGFVAFVVTGDSMVDDIHPGYIVFVDSWAEPKNGDIVAADVDGLTSVKIFKHEPMRGKLFLVAANKKYPPREITPRDNFRVLGVVKGHLRVY